MECIRLSYNLELLRKVAGDDTSFEGLSFGRVEEWN